MSPQQNPVDDIDAWDQHHQPTGSHAGANALQVYLASPELLECQDPLMYWLSQKKVGLVPGLLVDMAVDYLDVPGKFHFLNLQQRYYFTQKLHLSTVLNAGGGNWKHWGHMFSGFRTRPEILGVRQGSDCGFSSCAAPTY